MKITELNILRWPFIMIKVFCLWLKYFVYNLCVGVSLTTPLFLKEHEQGHWIFGSYTIVLIEEKKSRAF